MRRSFLCALFVVCVAHSAAADVIYDNGAPTGQQLLYTPSYWAADDFVLPSDSILTGILGWPGESWVLLRGPQEPTTFLATGPMFSQFAIPLQGGTRYWIGVFNGQLAEPCSISASVNLTTRNPATQPGVVISYPLGPVGPGDPLCQSGEPYDFSEPFWSVDDFGVEGDVAFTLVGHAVPEPTTLGLGLIAIGGLLVRRRTLARR